MSNPTVEEIRQIVLAEYKYWRDAEGPNHDADLMAMGAMGAAANIFGALNGHRAPWHPPLTVEPTKEAS